MEGLPVIIDYDQVIAVYPKRGTLSGEVMGVNIVFKHAGLVGINELNAESVQAAWKKHKEKEVK